MTNGTAGTAIAKWHRYAMLNFMTVLLNDGDSGLVVLALVGLLHDIWTIKKSPPHI